MHIARHPHRRFTVWGRLAAGCLVLAALLLFVAAPVAALPVPAAAVLRVAHNAIQQHITVFGSWGGTTSPTIESITPVDLGSSRLAFNVTVRPSGHLLIAADDELSPVLLYSDVSTFDPVRIADPHSIESWIIPEIGSRLGALKEMALGRPAGTRPDKWERTDTGRAWGRFDVMESTFQPRVRRRADQAGAPQAGGAATAEDTAGTVGPLLTTNWTQGYPYYNYTPADNGCTHTVAGCVAIAVSQIMKYWAWPASGVGSHSYVWTDALGTPHTLSANFAHLYNWSLMDAPLSNPDQIDAVARLVSDVGVAVEMDYGCGGSGAYTTYAATTAMPTYFGYKRPTQLSRSGYTGPQFFAYIQAELDAAPARPVLLAVRTLDGASGHALVIDGYQTASGQMAHLNLGWGAGYQGYYNINSDWSAGGYNWSATSQVIYPGLEPAGPQHALSVTKTGTGTGRVTSTPAGIDCGTTCGVFFDTGILVTLAATPGPGSHFTGWGGDCAANGTVTLTGDRTCTAGFDLDDPTALARAVDNPALSFSTGGSLGWFSQTAVSYLGGSAAQSGPIADSQTSSLQTTVTGPATFSFYWKVSSEGGWDFLTWYLDGVAQPGRISGAINWTLVTASLPAGTHTIRWDYSKDGSVSAGSDAGWVDDVVVVYPGYTLSVAKSGNGSGVVTSAPAGITCGATCSASFAPGSTVTLSAAADLGSIMVGWTGACSGLSTCTVTMDAARSVGAVFQSSPVYRRYFAEGAANRFFATSFALLNTDAAVTANVTLRFLRDDGATFRYLLSIPPSTRRTVDATQVPGLTPGAFSTIVESDVPVVSDRTLSWDATGYGAHAEMSVEAPAQTWFFAEGSTLRLGTVNGVQVGFSLYYLIENPNAQPVNVQITYLRPSPAPPITKSYLVNALSRRTILVNDEDPGLASTGVSGMVSSESPSLPIIVERALYLNSQGTPFGAGSDAAGATAMSLDWFLAEGATGPVFDEYVLIANPNGGTAELDVTYLLSGGGTLTKHYSVPPDTRHTIWVNGEQGNGVSLATGSVSTWVHSTNGVPVIAERALWWPSSGWRHWYETHASIGSTTTGTAWAMADGGQGGSRNVQTYYLVANTSPYPGSARVTLMFEDGTTASATVDVAANSRTTVWTGGTQQTPDSPFGGLTAGRRFGAVVESQVVNGRVAQIVVERSMYWDANGNWWAAGTNVVGTRLR